MTLRAGSSENRRFQEETKGQKQFPQNRSLPFKIGELEQTKKVFVWRCRVLLSGSKMKVIHNFTVIVKVVQSLIHNFSKHFFNI